MLFLSELKVAGKFTKAPTIVLVMLSMNIIMVQVTVFILRKWYVLKWHVLRLNLLHHGIQSLSDLFTVDMVWQNVFLMSYFLNKLYFPGTFVLK